MDFTNRSILVALVALAIPLVIHLLGHRQARRMALPTVRFAEGAHQARRGRLWIKRLALLTLRLAVVALLVLALAGPRLGGASLGTPERWLICLDTSPSMAAAGRAAAPGRATVFDAARTAVLQLLAALPDAAPATLALSDGRTFAETAREARDTLTGLPGASWHEEPLGRTIRRALGTLPRKTPPGAPGVHLVIATDATPWALRDLRPGAFKELVSDVTLLALTPAERVGWLGLPVTRVVSGPQGLVLEVDVEVASVGAGALRATLQVGDKPLVASPCPEGRSRMHLRTALEGDGPWQGRVYLLEDDTYVARPPSGVLAQPRAIGAVPQRFFTAAAGRPIRVLVVDAAEEKAARVRSADLVAATFGGDTAVPKIVTQCKAAEATAKLLEAADVVFWVGGQMPPSVAALEAFAARHGLVWIPADVSGVASTALEKALRLTTSSIYPVAGGATLESGGYASDLLAAFEGGTSGDLGAPIIARRLGLDAAGPGDLRFRDGAVAITDRRTAGGRIVAMAFGPAPAWGDLAGRAEFVVLMHSLAEALAPAAGPRAANYVLGRGTLPPLVADAAPGNYAAPAAADGQATASAEASFYSINADPDETADLTPHPERLAAAFDPEHVKSWDAGQPMPAVMTAAVGEGGTDLTAWFLVVMAAALAVEGLLAGLASTAPSSRSPLIL